MSESEPHVSQAQSEIDAHLAARAEQARKDLLDDILIGDGIHQESFKRTQVVNKRDGSSYERQIDVQGKPLNREEQAQRIEDARNYYAHLESLNTRDSGHDPYEQDLLLAAHSEALAENASRDAAAQAEKDHIAALEANIDADPRFRPLILVANKVKELRSHVVSENDDEPALQRELSSMEDILQELLVAYDGQGLDRASLEYILDNVYANDTEVSVDASVQDNLQEAGQNGGSEDDSLEPNETIESTEKGLELQQGDIVQYRDRNGNIIEGTLVAVLPLDNEDYNIYQIATADGRKPFVSFAQLLTTPINNPQEGAAHGVPALEGESLEEYEARNGGNGSANGSEVTSSGAEPAESDDEIDTLEDLDLAISRNGSSEATEAGAERGEQSKRSLWERIKEKLRPSYWAGKWAVVEGGIISKGTDPEKSDEENKAIEERNRRRLTIGKYWLAFGVGVAAGALIKGAIDGAIDASNAPDGSAGLADGSLTPDTDGAGAVAENLVEIPQPDLISILDNEGGTEAIQRIYGADADQARAIWDQVFNQFGTNALDHSSVGSGMMPDIIDVGGGNYGWSHEGLLSADMTTALNAAAENVIGS